MNESTQARPKSNGYHAIIVLGHHMDERGHPNNFSRTRIGSAAAAFCNGQAPLIVTSGWAYRKDVPLSLAAAMRDYAIREHHIPPEAIIADTHSRDTVGDAVFTKKNLAVPKGWNRLLVVTSEYHAARAQEIFTFIYGPGYDIAVKGVGDTATPAQAEAEQQSLQAFRETFEGVAAGDDEAIWKRLKERHPFYDGSTYPAI